ncbi:hypothetical protein WN943_010657 [Citrus x changshan-huyou]
MEPPKGFLASLWSFICFLPYFIGLLLLGIIKGIIFCPVICLMMTIGNSAIILGLLPAHVLWTYYCILRAKQLGPVLKLLTCICIPVFLILWPVDGTWSTIKHSFTIVRDFKDVCFHSYFSLMDDLRQKQAPDGKYYEIRLLYIPGAIIAGGLGVLIDVPVISVVALCKSPYMLFKGWHRLFHDLIGREGPFLETICVPLAGLAIILWPLAVVGAVLGSMVTSIFLGAYAGVVVYQESSLWFGLRYIIAALSIYDEYSNDILDMPEGSCFPRPQYRKKADLSRTSTFSRPSSFKDPPSRTSSLRKPIDLKPLELLERLFKECQRHGEIWVSEGLITAKDIEDAKSNSGSQVVSIGLPAYCLLQALLRSAMANSPGILLSDSVTEITSSNRPKDVFFDWFFNPFLIIKEQIKAENLTEAEEDYLSKLVLFCGNIGRLKDLNVSPPESERKQAELGALARRLQGITKSVSRYPTFRRQFDDLVKTLTEDLAKKNGGSESTNVPKTMQKSNSALARFQKSFKRLTNSNNGRYEESQSQSDALRDLEIL